MKEKFDINKNLRMLKYTLAKDDLYEFLDDVDSKMTKKIYSIIKSHERSIEDEGKGYDEIADLMTKLFQDDSNTSVYILERTRLAEDGKIKILPVSFIIYSGGRKDSKNAHMELIYTHKRFLNVGYAEILVENSFKDLIKEGYTSVTSIVADDNTPSLNFNQKLLQNFAEGRVYNRDNGTYGFAFDLTKLKEKGQERAD